MKILEKVGNLLTHRRLEQLQADVETVKATTDYVAMMTDVEIPTQEGDELNELV